MKQHFSTYEPVLQELKQKYEVSFHCCYHLASYPGPSHSSGRGLGTRLCYHPAASHLAPLICQAVTKEKMLASLERDRALSEVGGSVAVCYKYMHV